MISATAVLLWLLTTTYPAPVQHAQAVQRSASHSNEQNPVHEFNSPGEYDVTLTVTYPDGTTATTVRHVTVKK